MLILCMDVLSASVLGQNSYQLEGNVKNDQNQPLSGAIILLSPDQHVVVTDNQGNYTIGSLKKGVYNVEVILMGYTSLYDTLTVKNNKTYDIVLLRESHYLPEIVVTNAYTETRKKEESLNIEVIGKGYLKENLGGSLMESLAKLPGITTIDIGSGQSKPIIRGLGFNRVVVVENGIKHEGQQWGEDHGLEIDQYALDNIEVIKGPVSLIYGSDAIGGVIDIKQNHFPDKNTMGGNIELTGKSNNNLLGASLNLFGRKENFFADFRATFLDYGDYKVPTDSVNVYSYRVPLYKHQLRNTAGKEADLHAAFGFIKLNFQSVFYVSDINMKSGFFANAHGLEPRNVDETLYDQSNRDILYPYQQVNHLKCINITKWETGSWKWEATIGFQHNLRQEWSQYVSHGYMPAIFPDTLAFTPDLERKFDKYIYSGNLKTVYSIQERTILTGGLNMEYQDNRIDGRSFIIPAYRQLTAGTFLMVKHSFSEKSILQAGFRYDFGLITTQSYYDWFPSPVGTTSDSMEYLQRASDLKRHFSDLSWSIGYNYNPKNWILKINIGKSFRMPTAKELTSNGVNYHHFSYEVGDSALTPEISYQLDLGIEYARKKITVGITPFLNYFSNYIYLNPSYKHDRLYGNGNQIYYYTQCRVFRYGGEFYFTWKIIKSLQIGLAGEYVHSEQLSGAKKGYTLPFSPPASALFNIKYQVSGLRWFRNPYISLDYKLVAAQNDIVPPEEPTPGYQVINVGLGWEFIIKKQKIGCSFQIQNLLNSKYYNHTDYYRLINVPEPGRNFILNISIPFLWNLKSKTNKINK